MHRELRELLDKAVGISEFVIAVNIDIRGFSSFSMRVESSESAVFLKKVYRKLIDEYFPNASFFKPTGDGLLIIIPYAEEDLKDVLINTISVCLNVLTDFGSFCTNDPMINFDVPKMVGIGLSRGAACRLTSNNKTLDYSGRVLNLAPRLMDQARPSGIIFDTNFGIELFPEEIKEKFTKDSVYVKGVAEEEPLGIYYTTSLTILSPLNKKPLKRIDWRTIEVKKTLNQIKDFNNFKFSLPSEPIDPKQILIEITYPYVKNGEVQEGVVRFIDFSDFKYSLKGGEA